MADNLLPISAPREDLIKTAISFLLNPKVRRATDVQKEAFLKSRGLTDDEIRLAFERTISSGQLKSSTSILPGPLSYPYGAVVTPFQKFRDILHTVTLLIGAAYGIYYFVKKVILPFLFGKPKKPDAVQSKVNELSNTLTSSMGELKTDVQKIQGDLERVTIIQMEQQMLVRNLGDIKSELATVKGILLSRHQFPTVSLSGTSAIPAWQLASCREAADSGDESKSIDVVHPNSNGGSQGSDSSLEMIKEVDVEESEA